MALSLLLGLLSRGFSVPHAPAEVHEVNAHAARHDALVDVGAVQGAIGRDVLLWHYRGKKVTGKQRDRSQAGIKRRDRQGDSRLGGEEKAHKEKEPTREQKQGLLLYALLGLSQQFTLLMSFWFQRMIASIRGVGTPHKRAMSCRQPEHVATAQCESAISFTGEHRRQDSLSL